jgi:hypothetical protein
VAGVADVERIAALADPVCRNLQITQCYHELSQAMARLTGLGANWCSVATWASSQAGQSIRREDLARTLEDLLWRSAEAHQAAEAVAVRGTVISGRDAQARSIGGALDALHDAWSPAAAFDRTSDAVARGNRKVFEEIGLQFARFLALFELGPPDATDLDRFYGTMRPGDPPDGQRYLQRAFTRYQRALAEPDEKARAELLLLGNLEIGFHEQTRLQPEILEAMNAPVYDPALLRRRLIEELFPSLGSRVKLAVARLFGRAGALIEARDRLAREVQRLGRIAITERMMTLRLPGGRQFRLGHDLRVSFPPLLQQIVNPELGRLLAQVDLTPDSLDGTGAEDWSRLPERMHFIADLFRACHLDPGLHDAPFSAAQVAAIKAGVRPEDL